VPTPTILEDIPLVVCQLERTTRSSFTVRCDRFHYSTSLVLGQYMPLLLHPREGCKLLMSIAHHCIPKHRQITISLTSEILNKFRSVVKTSKYSLWVVDRGQRLWLPCYNWSEWCSCLCWPEVDWHCWTSCELAMGQQPDLVYKYAKTLTWYGLLNLCQRDTIHEADGPAMMSMWQTNILRFCSGKHINTWKLGMVC